MSSSYSIIVATENFLIKGQFSKVWHWDEHQISSARRIEFSCITQNWKLPSLPASNNNSYSGNFYLKLYLGINNLPIFTTFLATVSKSHQHTYSTFSHYQVVTTHNTTTTLVCTTAMETGVTGLLLLLN